MSFSESVEAVGNSGRNLGGGRGVAFAPMLAITKLFYLKTRDEQCVFSIDSIAPPVFAEGSVIDWEDNFC